jgi:hypothetical protein
MVNLLRGRLIDHKFTWNRTLLGEEVASIKDTFDQCSRVDRSMVQVVPRFTFVLDSSFLDKEKGIVKTS